MPIIQLLACLATVPSMQREEPSRHESSVSHQVPKFREPHKFRSAGGDRDRQLRGGVTYMVRAEWRLPKERHTSPSDPGAAAATMSLFLTDTHTDRITIQGRWATNAFLAYIRPQVLEWTTNMSQHRVRIGSSFDHSTNNAHGDYHTISTEPRLRSSTPFNGSHPVIMARFDLNMRPINGNRGPFLGEGASNLVLLSHLLLLDKKWSGMGTSRDGRECRISFKDSIVASFRDSCAQGMKERWRNATTRICTEAGQVNAKSHQFAPLLTR
jgi:hypothetical protein